MQPLGSSGNNNQLGKCSETSSKCVIWDGPDINCLGVNLCAGQSIEVVVYHTAKTLCDLLDMLNINKNFDLACLTPPTGGTAPENIKQLTQIIVDKLCELNQDVIDLQNTGSVPTYVDLPDCDAIIANCPAKDANGDPITLTYTDNNGNEVTKLLLISADGQTSPAVQYFATLICELFCRMTTAESEIADLRDDVDNLINQAAGALPSVVVPDCVNNNTAPQPMVDPNDPMSGAIPDMAILLCDIKDKLVGLDPLSTLTNYNINSNVACNTTIDTAAPLGAYPLMSPPPGDLGDLGAIANASTVQEVLTNMWVAICDLRNFANIVKTTCCPTLCADVVWDIAASLPQGFPGDRDRLRVILSGYFIDFYGATISASSSIPTPPGFGAGPLTTYNGSVAYTITVSDQSNTTATFNNTPVSDLFTPGNFIDLTGLITTYGLNGLDNWTVTFDSYIQAPDYSICNANLTLEIPAICDNQSLDSVGVIQVGYDGVTLQYVLPTTPGWPTSGTTPESFEITIYDPAFPLIPLETGTIPFYNYPNEYIYIYSDADHILPNPGDCIGGCANFYQTDVIEPNKFYFVTVSISYNCGVSIPTSSPTFKTFVPIEITLNTSGADLCVIQGDLTLVPEAGVPSADLSANFNYPIAFIPDQPVTTIVYAKAGTKFGFVLNTPYIVDTPVGVTPCNTLGGTRCWGPPSLYKYYSGNAAASAFRDTISDYPLAGCYDYIDCQLSVDGTLGYAGATSVKNAYNTGTNLEQPGNAVAIFDNSPTAIGYDDLQIPLTYALPQPIVFAITPTLHSTNSNAKPTLKIIIDDSQSWLTEQSLMYLQPTGQAAKTISYNADTASWFGAAGYTPVATSYTSSPQGWTTLPEGIPIFIQIEVYKWLGNGSWSSNPKATYYVTSDWLNANLPNITTTGFPMNTSLINLRDKVRIFWTTGCANHNVTSPYTTTVPFGDTVLSYGKLEISQDPYSALSPTIGPFSACDVKKNFSYNSVTGGFAIKDSACSTIDPAYTGCFLWGDTGNYPQKEVNVGGCPTTILSLGTNAAIEFIMTHDTTIKWTITDDTVPPTC